MIVGFNNHPGPAESMSGCGRARKMWAMCFVATILILAGLSLLTSNKASAEVGEKPAVPAGR